MVIRPPRKNARLLLRALAFGAAAGAFLGLPAAAAGAPLDRILAVVDEDPILASEVDLELGIGLVARQPGEDALGRAHGDRALRRRALDHLIEQRLRFHQVDRYGFTELPVEQVAARYAELAARFPSPEAFRARLAELGVGEEAVRQLVAHRLMVLTYVEERLGARVFVGLDEIKTYYDAVLIPELRKSGQPAPPIEAVRERIRSVLKEQRLNQELQVWTEELRREADILDHFDSVRVELPPVRWEAPAAAAAARAN